MTGVGLSSSKLSVVSLMTLARKLLAGEKTSADHDGVSGARVEAVDMDELAETKLGRPELAVAWC